MSTSYSRRAFLQQGSLVLLAAGCAASAFGQETRPTSVQLGLMTDLHYADQDRRGTRVYRDTLDKCAAAVKHFNDRKLPLVVMLGDLIDTAPTAAGEIGYLKKIDSVYAEFKGDRHYVLGNHCVSTLTKEQFRQNSGSKATYYSFDHAGFHFVILDACYRLDGVDYGKNNSKWTETEIPPAQREWLKDDLKKAAKPTIVFVHQRLDDTKDHSVASRADVRKILEDSGQVLAVFQGHSHRNACVAVNGIHYVTLRAMVEDAGEVNNAYSVLNVYANGDLILEGFKQQKGYEWPAKPRG